MEYFLGDNPFFGVNHRVGSKNLADQGERFDKACSVIIESINHGFSGFMLSSHTEGKALVDKATKHLAERNLQLRLALVIPYPHTINDLVASHGYVGGLKRLLGSTRAGFIYDLTRLLFMSRTALRKSLITSYIQAEKASFENDFVTVDSFCLHNVFTDMFLGLRRFDLIIEFIECCDAIGVTPVIISQNPVLAMSLVTKIPHVVCFSYNTLGYMVNPSLDSVNQAIIENGLESHKKLWAMQILASGNLSLEAALQDPMIQHFDGVLYATTRAERITALNH